MADKAESRLPSDHQHVVRGIHGARAIADDLQGSTNPLESWLATQLRKVAARAESQLRKGEPASQILRELDHVCESLEELARLASAIGDEPDPQKRAAMRKEFDRLVANASRSWGGHPRFTIGGRTAPSAISAIVWTALLVAIVVFVVLGHWWYAGVSVVAWCVHMVLREAGVYN